jgi:hypothetical protein
LKDEAVQQRGSRIAWQRGVKAEKLRGKAPGQWDTSRQLAGAVMGNGQWDSGVSPAGDRGTVGSRAIRQRGSGQLGAVGGGGKQ